MGRNQEKYVNERLFSPIYGQKSNLNTMKHFERLPVCEKNIFFTGKFGYNKNRY